MNQQIETVWEGWFHEALPQKAWIDVIGSGGKTSLIRWLAVGFAAVGRRVVITTSTHIYPIPDLWQECLPADRTLEAGEILQLGTLIREGKAAGKLTAPAQEQWQRLSGLADIILVEADGSRQLPLKFPAAHEPVLSKEATHTLIVQGLAALGQAFDTVCQRSELARQILPEVFENREQMMVDLPLMAAVLREGYRRVYRRRRCGICLNQADVLPVEEGLSAYRLALQSEELPVQALQLSDHPKKKIGLILMASGFGRRFGDNKLLFEVAGRPLIDSALELTAAVRHRLWAEGLACSICVVSRQAVVREKAKALWMTAIDNPGSEEGISATIRLGTVHMLEQGATCFVYLVADQPKLTAETVVRLIRRAIKSPLGLTVPAAGDRMGNPCVFAACYANKLLELKGEQGGKVIIREHMEDCQIVEVGPAELFDVDKKEQINTEF